MQGSAALRTAVVWPDELHALQRPCSRNHGLTDPVLVSGAAINLFPDLMTKVDIVQNTNDPAHSLGIACPRVAVLSAAETVTPDMPWSMDAAALSKRAERGQITGGLLDGPLAMDNAVDPAAAHTKGSLGAVAGRAGVLIVPNMDAGNTPSIG